jgi:hypothetical protein
VNFFKRLDADTKTLLGIRLEWKMGDSISVGFSDGTIFKLTLERNHRVVECSFSAAVY